MSTSFRTRLLSALGSSIVAVGVRIIVALVQVPVLLSFWSKEAYGAWVTMMAALAYVNLMDFGLSTVTMIRCGRFCAAREWSALSGTILVALAYSAGVSLLVAGVGLIAAPWLEQIVGGFEGVHGRLVIPLFVLYGSVALFSSTAIGVLRGSQRYSQALLVESAVQLCETGFLFAALWWLRDPFYCVGALMTARLFGVVATLVIIARIPNLTFSFACLDREVGREWLRTGGPATALPFGTATFLQGIIFLVASVLGSAEAGLFAASRTFTSFPERFTNVLGGLFTAEVAGEQAAEERFGRLFQISTELVILVHAAAFAAYFVVGGWAFNFWTRGKFTIDWPLIVLLLLSSLLRAWWGMNYSLLLGASRHRTATVAFLGISAFSLGVIATVATHFGLLGIAILLLCVDALMALTTLYFVSNLLEGAVSASLKSALFLNRSTKEVFRKSAEFRRT